MSGKYAHRKPRRSFFWAIILLGAGVIWLLSNLHIVPSENLWILFQLWPVLIILAGLDVIFARRLPLMGALLALVMIAAVVYIILNGSSVKLADPPSPRMESFQVEIGEATLVDFDLELSTQEVTFSALGNSPNLVEAEIGHFGNVEFSVKGVEEKRISLQPTGIISWFPWFFSEMVEEELVWDIRLNPNLPLNLYVKGRTGQSELDLAGVQLANFKFDGGTGSSKIILPASSEGYTARLNAGTGDLNVILPPESNLTLRVDGNTGRIVLDVLEDTPIQIEVLKGGSGDLQVPDWITKISGQEGRDEGVYQSEGFKEADSQLIICVENFGTGNIVVE